MQAHFRWFRACFRRRSKNMASEQTNSQAHQFFIQNEIVFLVQHKATFTDQGTFLETLKNAKWFREIASDAVMHDASLTRLIPFDQADKQEPRQPESNQPLTKLGEHIIEPFSLVFMPTRPGTDLLSLIENLNEEILKQAGASGNLRLEDARVPLCAASPNWVTMGSPIADGTGGPGT